MDGSHAGRILPIRNLMGTMRILVLILISAPVWLEARTSDCPGWFARVVLMKSRFETLALNDPAVISAVNRFPDYQYDTLHANFQRVESRLRGLIKSNDPHAAFLSRVLLVDDELTTPPKIFQSLNQLTEEKVLSGGGTESELLRVGRSMRMPDGKIRVLGLDDSIPDGAKSYGRLLPNRDYWQALADGYFPIGGDTKRLNSPEGLNLGDDFFHDLSHFSGLNREIEYQKGLRIAARSILQMSDETMSKSHDRLFFVSELFSCFPVGSGNRLQAFIASVRPGTPRSALSRREYAKILAKKSDKELKEIWKRSQTEIPAMHSVGGTSSDKIAQNSESAFETLAPLEYRFSGGVNADRLSSAYTRSTMIDKLSSRLTIVDHLQDTSPSQMVLDLVENRRDSATMRLICRNKELWLKIKMMGGICD